MINLKIKYCIIAFVLFISWAHVASAEVFINEVQTSPTGERFIELYNSGSSQDLTGWSIKRKTVSGTEYSLVSASRLEGKTILFNDYFLLVNENDYIGNITPDATWAKSNSFSNDNTIILYNSNGEISKVGYGKASECDDVCQSNPDSGKSLQRISNTNWIVATPTPGRENQSLNEEKNINNETGEEDTTVSIYKKESDSEILKITTKIISPKTVTEGIPFSINSLTTTNTGMTYAVGKYVWNFGDGMTSEISKAIPFDYIYEYAGEYAITLSFYNSTLSKVVDATSKVTIKVIPSEIYISSVGNETDPFVEIENKSNYDIILSDWVITGGIHYFKIPEGTTLLPNRKIKLSPKITGFTGEDIKSIIIINPNKNIVATYPVLTIQKPIQKNTSVYAIAQNNVSSVNKNSENNSFLNDSEIINLNDLGRSAEGAVDNIPKSTYAWMGLFVIIGLGVASFWIIKKRDNVTDYIEKEIRAEDMTIVE